MKRPLSVHWYNLVTRHFHNWRVRRQWKTDPNRPRSCPRAGAITQEAWEWANEKVAGNDELTADQIAYLHERADETRKRWADHAAGGEKP